MKKIYVAALLFLFALPAQGQQNSWDPVGKILGKKGTVQENMYKVTYPRTDLDVRIGDVKVDPRVGLTSWVGFIRNRNTMMMGDLVLKTDEVSAVIKKMMAEKIQVTALHNHLMGTSIPVMYLHFSGIGDATKLATSMKAILGLTGTPVEERTGPPETVPAAFSVVQYYLGTGNQQGAILKYDYPRNQTIMENDMEVPGFLGTATTFNFQEFEGQVAATGDFVMTANEVNPVIKALTDNGITVTAVHNHMLTEVPRLFYLHFWGFDRPENVAAGLRAALDKINVRRQPE